MLCALGRYLGDQRFSYGLDLAFTLRVGEDGARASVDDVIIEGDGRRISAPIFAQDNQVSDRSSLSLCSKLGVYVDVLSVSHTHVKNALCCSFPALVIDR